MKRSYFIFTIIALCAQIQLNAQYHIQVQMDGLSDSTIYLGNYYGDKQYAKDTAVLDAKGKAVFQGKEALPGGLYFVLLPGNVIFEVIIDQEQQFALKAKYSTKPDELNASVESKGSKDMDLYLDYQHFMNDKGKLAIDLRKRLKTTTNASAQKAIKDSLELLHQEVKNQWAKIHSEAPESLLSSILTINKDIEVPDSPLDENGKEIDPQYQYKYYKQHYFDYLNFSDERLLYTQFYHPKVERYFDQLVVPAPDSIIKEIKYVLDKSEANTEVFKYTLSMLFNKYNNSNIMGMDKVFVYLAENYYLNGKADWTEKEWLDKVKKRVKEIKPNILGLKGADIQYYSPEDEFSTLYMLNADYTILIFYEPGCGHCKKAITALKPLAEKFWNKGVEVLAIYTQVDKEEWINFIQERELESWNHGWDPYNQSNFRHNYDVQATPTIYLLDKDKKIVAKKLDVETLELVLNDKFGIKNPDTADK